MADDSVKITIAKVLHNAGLRNKSNIEVLNYIERMMKKHNHSSLITSENNYSRK